jgi:hypothetical protein
MRRGRANASFVAALSNSKRLAELDPFPAWRDENPLPLRDKEEESGNGI